MAKHSLHLVIFRLEESSRKIQLITLIHCLTVWLVHYISKKKKKYLQNRKCELGLELGITKYQL